MQPKNNNGRESFDDDEVNQHEHLMQDEQEHHSATNLAADTSPKQIHG